MREASAVSPFAAQTRQERQARWLEWQQQSVASVAAGEQIPAYQERQHGEAAKEPPMPYIPHSRYDAVIQRMQKAKQQTGAYSTWS